MTNAPTILNLFHNIDFVFQCDYPFTDRYNGEEDFFNGSVKVPAQGFSDTNFIRDVGSFELMERKDRGAGGRLIMIEMANNVMSAHISQFPVGTYKKAHRHGAGAHVIILKGEGFSVMWRRAKIPKDTTGAPAACWFRRSVGFISTSTSAPSRPAIWRSSLSAAENFPASENSGVRRRA